MSEELEGRGESLWVATTPETTYPALSGDDRIYDVVIVGGGITGIVTAHHALERGLSVALVERGHLAEWTTGGTTAKLSSQHYLIYDYLIGRHGQDAAGEYGRANEYGIDAVERLSAQYGIDCEFSRRSAYVFSADEGRVEEMQREVDAARSLGLPATFETEIDLPFEIAGAVRFADQAQFHPRKFLLGLAQRVTAAGGVIYENTNATDIRTGRPNVVVTEHGELKAERRCSRVSCG